MPPEVVESYESNEDFLKKAHRILMEVSYGYLRNTLHIIGAVVIVIVSYPRESEIKNLLSLPNFYFPVEAHKAGQIYKGGFGDMSPHENFEIFNAKSYILSRVMMFENKWMCLTLFCCL